MFLSVTMNPLSSSVTPAVSSPMPAVAGTVPTARSSFSQVNLCRLSATSAYTTFNSPSLSREQKFTFVTTVIPSFDQNLLQ